MWAWSHGRLSTSSLRTSTMSTSFTYAQIRLLRAVYVLDSDPFEEIYRVIATMFDVPAHVVQTWVVTETRSREPTIFEEEHFLQNDHSYQVEDSIQPTVINPQPALFAQSSSGAKDAQHDKVEGTFQPNTASPRCAEPTDSDSDQERTSGVFSEEESVSGRKLFLLPIETTNVVARRQLVYGRGRRLTVEQCDVLLGVFTDDPKGSWEDHRKIADDYKISQRTWQNWFWRANHAQVASHRVFRKYTATELRKLELLYQENGMPTWAFSRKIASDFGLRPLRIHRWFIRRHARKAGMPHPTSRRS
ncbi:hypothetical protein MKEN_00115100 [Mycena kentingensis (nom. inval.)]|nr:hypothetical protein MKEN_00115100 [Mycena kentingensis (nom. inval.)]